MSQDEQALNADQIAAVARHRGIIADIDAAERRYIEEHRPDKSKEDTKDDKRD